MEELIKKAHVLTEEALPYMQKFKNKIVVVKYGGNAMIHGKKSVMKDIVLLKHVGILPVVVHGGGPFVTKEMEKLQLKAKFVNGLRVTDGETIKIIKKVFKKINNDINAVIKKLGGKSVSVDNVIMVKQKNKKLGLVGEIIKVDVGKIKKVLKKGSIPVISPLGVNGKVYNINADDVATKVAVALKAEKLTILTDVDGVIENGKLISHLSINDANGFIKKKIITKGMIPKVKACVEAVKAGCKKAHLINGTIDHALLLEIFTDKGIGTEVVKQNGAVKKLKK